MIPDLECQSLTKSFTETTAVKGVSFSVAPGSFFSILGPSGCGKTTIMRMIAGFLEPTGGDIRIKGKSMLNVPPNKRPVNMVFQHLALFPMMNIAENIGYGLRRVGLPKAEITRKVGEVLDRVGLPGIENRKIDELSGGQKQRVAIARCMVLEPDVLLLDEPLGALDLKLRERMKIELKSLQAAFDTTFVYITHDQSEALVMSDQIAVMNEGQFEQVGTARDLYYRPQSAFVAGFVGDSNRWTGTVEQAEGNRIALRTQDGMLITSATQGGSLPTGSMAEIFLRPEAVRVAHDAADLARFDNRLSGEVSSLLFNGAASRILVRGDTGQQIEVTLPQSGEFASLAKGAPVHIGWAGEQTACFSAEP
ncbi:ABC transporter ATP-binding protein [Sedimentitalea todarodis]|uniref:ABC transporter ATP-binding protein n=1 Tax=Sedimentitalea todarodis TaxID=1631240 RepID=A0ABU3VA60_9RHOB|nr:ABC transporter ATP-binding protein [Sedimentitalea todarodis]MDU9002968.1 ABC transporter ATP-binding protein [Sedimentitalea todarodis]